MAREFKGCSTVSDDSISDPLGEGDMVRIAWGEVGSGLSNTNDWLLLV